MSEDGFKSFLKVSNKEYSKIEELLKGVELKGEIIPSSKDEHELASYKNRKSLKRYKKIANFLKDNSYSSSKLFFDYALENNITAIVLNSLQMIRSINKADENNPLLKGYLEQRHISDLINEEDEKEVLRYFSHNNFKLGIIPFRLKPEYSASKKEEKIIGFSKGLSGEGLTGCTLVYLLKE